MWKRKIEVFRQNGIGGFPWRRLLFDTWLSAASTELIQMDWMQTWLGMGPIEALGKLYLKSNLFSLLYCLRSREWQDIRFWEDSGGVIFCGVRNSAICTGSVFCQFFLAWLSLHPIRIGIRSSMLKEIWMIEWFKNLQPLCQVLKKSILMNWRKTKRIRKLEASGQYSCKSYSKKLYNDVSAGEFLHFKMI